MSKVDKRREILRAAQELISERGFHGAPMAMIASRAKVAAGTIYCYFESKDILINELYLEIETRIMGELLREEDLELPVRQRFVTLFTRILEYLARNPLDFRYIEQFHNSPYGDEYRRDTILGKPDDCDVFRDIFEQGIEQGLVKNLPLIILFSLSFGPLLAVVRDHILGFVTLDGPLTEIIASACWDAVKC